LPDRAAISKTRAIHRISTNFGEEIDGGRRITLALDSAEHEEAVGDVQFQLELFVDTLCLMRQRSAKTRGKTPAMDAPW
jgi:hypothetical protein